jgi:hypothetical protein
MRRWLLSGIVWLLATAVLLPVFGFLAILLAGPHSDILPTMLQPPVFITCVLAVLVVPVWLARLVWKRTL